MCYFEDFLPDNYCTPLLHCCFAYKLQNILPDLLYKGYKDYKGVGLQPENLADRLPDLLYKVCSKSAPT
eukprot:scaffold137180_cov16-Tisochrysis_lutea.AAC.1